MELHKITQNITRITGKPQGKFPFSHSFLIEDDITALIDTGCGIKILQELKNLKPIDMVINSHSHPDHTAGNWVFPDIPLVVPKEEINFNSNINLLSHRYAKECALTWREFVSGTMEFRDAHPSKSFEDGKIFDFGNTVLEAVHTPGHTIGHYCFFERDKKILFSFDIDFSGFGPWYGHEESDIDQFVASINEVRMLKPETVVSSHKHTITKGIDQKFQQFLRVFQIREQKILKFLEKERTITDIVDSALIYRDFSFHPELLRYWEKMMIKKHLEKLVRTGLVKEINNTCGSKTFLKF
ncbi:MAG: MBL fold metallo-hydrolase [Candidatus Methanofastidiosia archaeon]